MERLAALVQYEKGEVSQESRETTSQGHVFGELRFAP